jgi:hypothetical protein
MSEDSRVDIGQTPRLRVLLLVAHPRRTSLCCALADAYAEGARCAGIDFRRCDLAALRFEPNVTTISPRDQFCEDDIRSAMQAIAWEGAAGLGLWPPSASLCSPACPRTFTRPTLSGAWWFAAPASGHSNRLTTEL